MAGLNELKYEIDSPSEPTGEGIIFIPGASGGALGSRWQGLADAAVRNGFCLLRFESWAGPKELEQKCIKEVRQEIDWLIGKLSQKGCRRIGIVAKSFGGMIALAYMNSLVGGMVLWAPALGVSQSPNITESTPFGEFENAQDINPGKEDLSGLKIPVRIIHGTADDVVDIGNSRKLIEALPSAELVTMLGAGHSFKPESCQKELFNKTLEFLKKVLK